MGIGFRANGIEEAVQIITRYLEDSNSSTIFFGGWDGLGASTVLKAIAQHPPPSLLEKFDQIIHIDCSKWKSRRALQRAIVDELELHQWVNDAFHRQDKEDDFSGRDECSRTEIKDVTAVILRFLTQYRCLVIFHNGSIGMVDLVDFGIPPQVLGTRVLWTYGGWIHHMGSTLQEKGPSSHEIYCVSRKPTSTWKVLIAEEAKEIALYTHRLGVTPEVIKMCYMYLLSLNHEGDNMIDYNWATHASNYWVCDGIVAGGHENQAWEIARALHQEICLEDYSSTTLLHFGIELDAPPNNRWIFVTPSNFEEKAHPGATSLFIASSPSVSVRPLLAQLPFRKLDQLHVLKVCRCSFSFQSPPFHCCHNLRFLGLESCMDQQQARVEDNGCQAVEIFQKLWVLDVCYTDWDLAFPQESKKEIATEIRELHIKKGKIWHNNFGWRKLRNLRKLCIVGPTCSWETGEEDEFKGMVNLEHLELSRNSSTQFLPSMSSATGLKTLILESCVRLEHVGPEGLPPSLESFSFNAGSDLTMISKISLAGCVHLKSFMLRGEFPDLEELDLSGTSVKILDLSSTLVQVSGLNKVILMGCKQLCALLLSQKHRQLKMLRIDTNGRNEQTHQPCSESSLCSQYRNYDGYVIASDARFIQSLLQGSNQIITNSLYLHLDAAPLSTSTSERRSSSSRSDKQDMIPKPWCYSSDASLEGIPASNGGGDGDILWPPASDRHVEVSEGISLTDAEGDNAIDAIHRMMMLVHSLDVHDNSRMLAANTKDTSGLNRFLPGDLRRSFGLRWCRVERCPKLQTVFMAYNTGDYHEFPNLGTIWASHLHMAACIWSKGFLNSGVTRIHPLPRLRSIHIYNCPRLKFVLPLSSTKVAFPRLETLHITHCGDLRQVFPWDDVKEPPTQEHIRQARAAVKEFPKLKHIHLHDLPSLEEICQGSRMWAPMLESVELRGCWALRRLPAVRPAAVVRVVGDYPGHYRHLPVVRPAAVVRCERDCWEKLQWDGLDAGHHPSLYEPLFSSRYYRKKGLLRGTVLR